MISRNMTRKILSGNFEKSFLEWEKITSRKIFRNSSKQFFFMFILLIGLNHTAFLVRFGINLHLWVFIKLSWNYTISAFWKTHSFKLIQNGTRKRITYTFFAAGVNASIHDNWLNFRFSFSPLKLAYCLWSQEHVVIIWYCRIRDLFPCLEKNKTSKQPKLTILAQL